MECLFCAIADGTIPSTKVYEDEQVVAFRDIHAQAPVHILVIPRRHIASLQDSSDGDEVLLGRLMRTVRRLAEREGLQRGYRVVVNVGEQGGQTVSHLHLHLLGGRDMQWPPG